MQSLHASAHILVKLQNPSKVLHMIYQRMFTICILNAYYSYRLFSIDNIIYNFSGCHEDMNCASETGTEASNVTECCARRNMRSFRNPIDGTCQRCPSTPGNVSTVIIFIYVLVDKCILSYVCIYVLFRDLW